jgi:hypothetical protein
VAQQPLRSVGPFARATREALESVVAPTVAEPLLARAIAATEGGGVPEEVMRFRDFVEGPLRSELGQLVGPATVALVLERLGQVLWMATSDVRALSVARDWSRGGATSAHESGSHPKIPQRSSDRPEVTSGETRRPTIPVPRSSPPTSSSSDRPRPAPSSRPPVAPAPARPTVTSGMTLRTPRNAVTVSAMPRVASTPTATGVLVVTLDAALSAKATSEIAGRCPVLTIGSPVELARAATRSGDRVVVIVDTTLPSIDLPTFAGLAPILPPDTRIVLWGADERVIARLAARFPAARTWVPSGDSTTPGKLALALG